MRPWTRISHRCDNAWMHRLVRSAVQWDRTGEVGHMSAFTFTGDGFRSLWGVVVEVELEPLRRSFPDAAIRLSADEPERAVELVNAVGVRVAQPRALETGAAYRQAVFRLENLVRLASREPVSTTAGLATVVQDVWPVYLAALLDAMKQFTDCALKRTVKGDDEVRQLRKEIAEIGRAEMEAIGPLRQPVAHANTRHIEAITQEGHWAGVLLLGGGVEEWLLEIFQSGQASDLDGHPRRAAQLAFKTVTLEIICDRQLARVAKLITSRGSADEQIADPCL